MIPQCPFKDIIVLSRNTFIDKRGEFFEIYREKDLNEKFIQDNISISKKNTLRGLHFQYNPPQGKLVSVVKGSVIDIILDIRKNSKTYGKVFTIVLSEKNKKQVWIPAGYAHGFLSLEDDTILFYKCTEYWSKIGEGCVSPIDPYLDINLDVDLSNIIISSKDKNAQSFLEYDKNPYF
jgi:dTDP-4-dehydrorhamnose 3,5-epimerase